MKTQHLIKRKLARAESITIIRQILEDNDNLPRSKIAERVCEHFLFFNARGKPQRSGCLKALRELERVGHFLLPKARFCPPRNRPRRLSDPVELPQNVPAKAGEVRGLRLIKVEAEAEVRIWNELMLGEHPKGAGPLVGTQLRYLIHSQHGWLGGLGFSACALQLKDRDRWIGWDASTRQQHLHRVIGMSRFLIRPSVRCHNLASHVMGMTLRQLASDFEVRYGYRPWLVESFVETAHYSGTCYRAANWVLVGQTQGRGRQDRENNKAETRKAIYLYPLEKDFRTRLGVPDEAKQKTLDITAGLDGAQWANNEFGGAQLGDQRLSHRLVESAVIQAQTPGRAFCGAAQGDWPLVKGYYRMIDKPDDDALTMAAILAPHRLRTVQRMSAQQRVLCIQDGTDLNYSSLVRCEGLGMIGTNQTGANSRGLHLHSTLTVTPEGLPLGVLSAQCWAPTPKSTAQSQPARTLPIEEKKTFCWIRSLRDSVALAKEIPHTHQVCVMDREADFFELFDEPRPRQVDLLVRAQHDRSTGGEFKLFDTLRQSPVCSHLSILVPRQSARAKRSKQKSRPKRAQRTAHVALRYQQIELRPSAYHKGKAPIKLWAIHLRETSPPSNEKPIEWFLLTTCDITCVDEAEQCIGWYNLRWRIEDWHRVLKSGCRIEALAHKTAERLKRAIGINLVIAWRIMLMTLLGRACPQLPTEVLFSDLEIKVLRSYALKKTLTPPYNSEMLCIW